MDGYRCYATIPIIVIARLVIEATALVVRLGTKIDCFLDDNFISSTAAVHEFVDLFSNTY